MHLDANKKDVVPESSSTTASSSTGTIAFSETVSTNDVLPSELPSAVASTWSAAPTKLVNPRAFEEPTLDGSFVLKDPTSKGKDCQRHP